jgi:hypothetical protein
MRYEPIAVLDQARFAARPIRLIHLQALVGQAEWIEAERNLE